MRGNCGVWSIDLGFIACGLSVLFVRVESIDELFDEGNQSQDILTNIVYILNCSWLHEQNFSEIVRPFYGRRLPWVYKLWYPEWRLKNQAQQVLISMYRDAEDQPSSVELFVVEKAKKCITLLSQKLGTNEFFMGTSSPTTMDAIVFSYLALFWKVSLKHNPLKEAITATPNLDRYLARILQRYFPVSSGK